MAQFVFSTGEKLLVCIFDNEYQKKFETLPFLGDELDKIKAVKCKSTYYSISSIIITETKTFQSKTMSEFGSNENFIQLEFDGEVNNAFLSYHRIIINSKGKLWCAYVHEMFEPSSPYDRFRQISFHYTVNKLDCGSGHIIIITDGGIFSSGDNMCGQLGLGHTVEVGGFHRINLEISYPDVCCGEINTFIYNEEELWAFGNNYHCQLGFESDNICSTPKRVPITGLILKIVPGTLHSFFLTSEGFYGCGSNEYGELGLKERNKSNLITKIAFNEPISDIMVSGSTTVINSEGDLYVCGSYLEALFGLDSTISDFQLVPLEDKIIPWNNIGRFKSTKRAN